MKSNLKQIFYLLIIIQLLTNCNGYQNYDNQFFESIISNQKENRIDSFSNLMLTHYLIDLGERSISNDQKSVGEVYRFTYIPHYSTKNYVYTITLEQNNYIGRSSTVEYDLTKNTVIDFQTKTSTVNKNKINQLNELVDKNHIWDVSTHSDYSGVDGSDWILEIKNKKGYKLVTRWSLEKIGTDPKIYEICQLIKEIVNE